VEPKIVQLLPGAASVGGSEEEPTLRVEQDVSELTECKEVRIAARNPAATAPACWTDG
jgi:hypothetical protein